jgi:hypothetical protein
MSTIARKRWNYLMKPIKIFGPSAFTKRPAGKSLIFRTNSRFTFVPASPNNNNKQAKKQANLNLKAKKKQLEHNKKWKNTTNYINRMASIKNLRYPNKRVLKLHK